MKTYHPFMIPPKFGYETPTCSSRILLGIDPFRTSLPLWRLKHLQINY